MVVLVVLGLNGSFGFGAFAIKVSSVDEKYQSTPYNAQSLNWFHARVGKRQKQGQSRRSGAGMALFRHATRQVGAFYGFPEDFCRDESHSRVCPESLRCSRRSPVRRPLCADHPGSFFNGTRRGGTRPGANAALGRQAHGAAQPCRQAVPAEDGPGNYSVAVRPDRDISAHQPVSRQGCAWPRRPASRFPCPGRSQGSRHGPARGGRDDDRQDAQLARAAYLAIIMPFHRIIVPAMLAQILAK